MKLKCQDKPDASYQAALLILNLQHNLPLNEVETKYLEAMKHIDKQESD
jgi:hypothetical protein